LQIREAAASRSGARDPPDDAPPAMRHGPVTRSAQTGRVIARRIHVGASDTIRTSRALAALAGIVAALAGFGGAELAAGLLPGAPSLLLAVGQTVIDLQPPGAKDVAVALFGTNDKLALEIVVVFVSLAIAAGLGILARSHWALGSGGFAAFAALGFLAAVRAGSPATVTVLPTLAAAGAAIAVLAWLIPDTARGGAAPMPDWDRRAFLLRTGGLAVASVAAGVVGRRLLEGQRAAVASVGSSLPPPTEIATLPDGADLSVPGLTPIVVPNDDFYRIDTALITPRIDVAGWQLRIHGMVDRETTLSFAELAALPEFEQYVTIACVSNEVGDRLVGNAKWTGVRLRDILAMAGVQAGATQLVGRSVDGWTAGMPTAWVMDPAREPMIALRMNGEPLPMEHGFPARLIVPGLYGYVSATKWLAELELTTLEAFDAFWVPRGWAKEAPILTQSRIDVPGYGTFVPPGRTAVAGVAWAPDRGISRVEVQVDDGPWQATTLSVPISDATWVQWRLAWDATPGRHQLAVRATDGDGVVQTADRTPPIPDGARGHHTIVVNVG
jgi:DMSO/TMAO reductase YedYZ molybdopterin-dependent catalytic subunit